MQNPSSPLPNQGVAHLLRRRPLLSFFVLAYAISWILSIPFILADWGVIKGDLTIVFALKSYGPLAAAFIMTFVLEGKAGVQRLQRSFRELRGGWALMLFIFLGIPALLMAGILLQPTKLDGFVGLSPALLVNYAVMFVLVTFGGGPVGEEPGWRGFALSRLQQRHGPLWGTLLLSIVWTCWHLPDFLTRAQGGGPGPGWQAFFTNFPIFLLLVTALAILMTWVYNKSNGSLLTAILAHASVNTPQLALVPLFPAVDTTALNLGAMIGFGVTALLILVLTRGRLGYQPGQEQTAQSTKIKAQPAA